MISNVRVLVCLMAIALAAISGCSTESGTAVLPGNSANNGGSNGGSGQSGSGSGNTTLLRVAKVILQPGDSSLYSAVIDTAHGYAYFSTSGSIVPGRFIKVALGAGNSAPVEVAAISLPAGQEGVITSVIDTIHGYAYLGNLESPARIIKIALGAGDTPPSIVGSAILNSGERNLFGSAIDVANGYAYFSCGVNPARIVKVALGAGNAPPSRVSGVTLASGAAFPSRLVLDGVHGYAYTVTSPAAGTTEVVKLSVGVGNSSPAQVSKAALPIGDGGFQFADIDTAAGYLYLAGANPGNAFDDTTSGIVVKVRLNAGDVAPTYVGALTVPDKFFSAGGIDPIKHQLFMSNDLTFPASTVVQIALGQGDDLPSLVKTIRLLPGTAPYTFATRPIPADAVLAGEIYVRSGAIDPAAGYIYFGTDTRPGQVIKVAIPTP